MTHAEKIKAGREAKKAMYFSAECGRIKVQEHEFGIRLFLNRNDPWHYATLYSALTTRKTKEWLALHGTDAEKNFVANLVAQIN